VSSESSGSVFPSPCLAAAGDRESSAHVQCARSTTPRRAKPFHVGPLRSGKRSSILSQDRGENQVAIFVGQSRGLAREEVGIRAAFVDCEIVNHRLHGEGHAARELPAEGLDEETPSAHGHTTIQISSIPARTAPLPTRLTTERSVPCSSKRVCMRRLHCAVPAAVITAFLTCMPYRFLFARSPRTTASRYGTSSSGCRAADH